MSIDARLQGLAAAADAAEGRLDEGLVAEAREVTERAASRMKLSSAHTVVGIAGATGSGKSSTFNALTGLELSAVGVRRPTTSWATACVWGSEGARELLEWLGIPDRHQTTRDSMLDTHREGNELDGVVLLDLPDHDSTEVSHHLEVDRLVALADMLIWVVDPQKYADAAIHDRYLEPFKTHSEVMVVVLNHIDEVPEEQRDSMVADLKRLLVNDGLPDVPVLPVAARLGWGIPELRTLIAERVADKRMTTGRLEADARRTAARLQEVSGTAEPRKLDPAAVDSFHRGLAEAAGIPAVVEAVERSTMIRATRFTGWPPTAWIARLRKDPLARLQSELGPGELAEAGKPTIGTVPRPIVESQVRELADEASAGLGAPWQRSITEVASGQVGALGERLDSAFHGSALGVGGLPGWVRVVGVVQWLLIAVAVLGGVWTGVRASQHTLGSLSKVAGLAFPAAVAVACLVLGIVIALLSRLFVGSAARKRAALVDARLRGAVAEAGNELVIGPIEAELAAYAQTWQGIRVALG